MDEKFDVDSYTEFLEEEFSKQLACIGAVQEFLIHFFELLEFLGENIGDAPDDPISIQSPVYQELLETRLAKCTTALEDFQEKQGSLIELQD